MLLTVGELAKMTGLTVRALHHYDARGLLVPSQRSDAGYRLYSQADVVRLYRIQALQRLGLSLGDIAKALDRDDNTLPTLIRQQLSELDEQIARTTLVRDQLRQLETRLSASEGPSLTEWLRALEVLATYDKHCSVEDLQRLLKHNNDADWPPFIRDVKAAMDREVKHDSAEARTLALRWTALVMSRFGADPALAKKMKLAYLDDPGVRNHVQAQSGFDLTMMRFCTSITTRAHVHFWSRHLTADEVAELRISDEWARDLAAFLAQANEPVATSLRPDLALRHSWKQMLSAFVGVDERLGSKVEAALLIDPDLRTLWSLTPAALERIR